MTEYVRNTLTGDLAPVNAELEKIQNSLATKFDRIPSTGQANQLRTTQDANSNRIINLGAPVNESDAARLADCVGGAGIKAQVEANTAKLSTIEEGAEVNTVDTVNGQGGDVVVDVKINNYDSIASLSLEAGTLILHTTYGIQYRVSDTDLGSLNIQLANGKYAIPIAPYTLEHFGGKGDNSTDNSGPFNKWLGFVDSVFDRTLEFCGGTYQFGSALTVNKNRIALRGRGGTNVIFKKSFNGTLITFFKGKTAGTQVQYIVLDNIAVQSNTGTDTGAAFAFSSALYVYLKDLNIRNMSVGIQLVACSQVYAENVYIVVDSGRIVQAQHHLLFSEDAAAVKPQNNDCFFKNCNLRGPAGTALVNNAVTINSSDGIWFDGCHFGNTAVADVRITPATGTSILTGVKFDNCWFDSCNGSGLLIDGSTTSTYGLIDISDCRFNGSTTGTYGIRVAPTTVGQLREVSIADCVIRNWGYHGVYVQNCDNFSIRGCTVQGANRDSTGSSGITISGSSNFGISDVKSGWTTAMGTSLAEYGCYIVSGCDNYTISNCDFQGNTTGALLDSGGVNKKVSTILGQNDTVNFTTTGSITLPSGIDYVRVTGTGTIEGITSKAEGKSYTVYFSSTPTIDVDAGNFTGISSDVSVTAGSVYRFIYDSTDDVWRVIAEYVA